MSPNQNGFLLLSFILINPSFRARRCAARHPAQGRAGVVRAGSPADRCNAAQEVRSLDDKRSVATWGRWTPIKTFLPVVGEAVLAAAKETFLKLVQRSTSRNGQQGPDERPLPHTQPRKNQSFEKVGTELPHTRSPKLAACVAVDAPEAFWPNEAPETCTAAPLAISPNEAECVGVDPPVANSPKDAECVGVPKMLTELLLFISVGDMPG
jgi:hypothetical protein